MLLTPMMTWGAAALICAATGAMGQQPIPAPILKPFADNRQWVLFSDLNYVVGTTSIVITVPKGFVTDFASIPRALWSFGLSPNGTYSKAAIVHDYLYWIQRCTRLQADNILDIAMKEAKVEPITRTAIYEGVRAGGRSAWRQNASEKLAGLPRLIPESAIEFGPTVFWAEYRKTLKDQRVRDPIVPSHPAYCAIGNTTNVPTK